MAGNVYPDGCRGCKSREAKKIVEEANEVLSRILVESKGIESSKKAFAEALKKSNEILEKQRSSSLEMEGLLSSAVEISDGARLKVQSALDSLSEIRGEIDNLSDFSEKISNAEELIEEANSAVMKIDQVVTGVAAKKAKIDKIFFEIVGTEIKKEDGEIERIDGLRDELASSYDEIKESVGSLESDVEDLISKIEMDFNSKVEVLESKINKMISDGAGKVESVTKELEGLLPGGMAMGLSHAYKEKKDSEEVNLASHSESFRKYVFLMLGLAIIPVGISAILMVSGDSLQVVISRAPQIFLAILPIYLPATWLAYTAGKQRNLSKRLIEEYTHKEALGKTFSGLSKQIDDLPDSVDGDIRSDLRSRLLYIMIQVSSENPGKLITDYNKSDHPILDVLDKSSKLADSIESMSKIPGISLIAKKVDELAAVKREEAKRKVEAALGASVLSSSVPSKDVENPDKVDS